MARAGFCNTIIYILSLYLAQTGAHSDPCMKDWREVPGFGVCIRAFPLKKTFEEAIDYCAEFGADLVKIWNPAMNDVVTGLTKETDDVFYIGLKYFMQGTKKYSRWRGDGREARYKNWRKGKLINKQKACAVIGHDGKWIEWDCTDKQKFVCGKASRLCPSSFFFSSYSGTCIRFIYQKLDWDSANEFCQEKLDAKLVRIINKRMNEFLSDRDIHIGSFPLWMDFDGRKDIDDSRWLNSTIGYTNWASGQPGNKTPICAGIHTSTGNWYNYNCSISRYVICEKFPTCPFFTYGLYCQENCSENCAGPKKTCDPIDGTCILGCKAGYQGEKCNEACSVFTYGLNCQENCSEHCAGPNKTCDPTNGTCISGCEVGYQGEKCYKECSFFTYGLNCQENCSENCAGPNKTCDPTNGTCILGCEVGYQGENCDKGILNIAFLTPEARTGYSNLAIVSASSFAAIVLLICVAPALCRKKTDTGTQEPQQHVEDIAVSSQPEANEDHYPSKMPDTNSGLDYSPSNDEQETWPSEQSSVEDEEYED